MNAVNMITEYTPFRAEEVVFFSADGTAVKMMRALLGIGEEPTGEGSPRLLVCDGDDPAQCAAWKGSPFTGTPTLFYTADPAGFTPPELIAPHLVLRRPFLFAEFRRAAAQLCQGTHLSDTASGADAPAAVPFVPLIRVENQAAVWRDVRIPLSPCEAGVLTALTKAYPGAVSRVRLASVFTRSGSNSVSVYVSYLRKKLSAIPAFRDVISVKGGGFALLMHDNPPHTPRGE